MNRPKPTTKQALPPRVREGLQWLGSLVKEIKFGSIRGLVVRDGVIGKGPGFRVTSTGKPSRSRPPNNRPTQASDQALKEALLDLARDTYRLTGEQKLKVKIANGTLLSWDVEHSGHSTHPEADKPGN